LALIEDASGLLRHIELLPSDIIGSAGEARLLALAMQSSPRLPVSSTDVFIVDPWAKIAPAP
jgi:hypothetical protein